QIEEVSRVDNNSFLFTVGDKHLTISGDFVDPGFLTMFSFPLVNGNPKTALNSIKDIIITQKLSKKLFGNDNAMGKTIKIDSNAYFTVSGVMKDLPNNTQFNFEFLLPFKYMNKLGWEDTGWGNNSIQTWVLLKPGI